MTGASANIASNANLRTARSFQNPASRLPTNSVVMQVARAFWPKKTDLALSEHTGVGDRMCRYWLKNTYSLSADDLAALIRSDAGMQVLEAIMGDARPVWWKRFRQNAERAELRRAQKALQKKLEQMEQELDCAE